MHTKTISLHRHTIAKHEINLLPITSYAGAIHTIDSDAKMHAAVHSLIGEKVLGFDTETRPAFKVGESYPPSIIQLAATGVVYVFQLRHISSYEPLAGILADKKILKAGVSVSDDIKNLNKLFSFNPSGFIDIADLARSAGIKSAGIRSLAALLFNCRISKGTKCSRWDSPKLTDAQIVYAATDAWMSRELYLALVRIIGNTNQVIS